MGSVISTDQCVMLTFPLRNAKTILKKQMIRSKPPSDKRAGSLFVCLSSIYVDHV